MHADLRTSAIRRFFTGLTEYAFHARLGVADPPLVDYIAELLVRFVRCDELYRVRSVRGQRLMQVTDMLAEAQHREGPRGSRSTGTSATSRCSGRASTRKWSRACAAAAKTR